MTVVNRRVVIIGAVMIPLTFALVFHHRVLAAVLIAVLAPLLFRTVPAMTRIEERSDDLHWICLGAPLRARKGATWDCPDCGRSYLDTGWRWLEQEKVTT